jgi:hypothetical protein
LAGFVFEFTRGDGFVAVEPTHPDLRQPRPRLFGLAEGDAHLAQEIGIARRGVGFDQVV